MYSFRSRLFDLNWIDTGGGGGGGGGEEVNVLSIFWIYFGKKRIDVRYDYVVTTPRQLYK